MLVSMAAGLSASGEQAIDWHADYGVALEESKEAAQPLLVVLDAPGKEGESLDPNLLSPETGDFPLTDYELCRVDVSTEYGQRVAEAFKVTEFPHVAIIDKSGAVILQRIAGDVTADEWKATLQRHARGNRVGRTLYTVAKPVIKATPVSDSPAAVAPSPQPTPSYVPQVQPTASYGYGAPSRSYCPSCQRR